MALAIAFLGLGEFLPDRAGLNNQGLPWLWLWTQKFILSIPLSMQHIGICFERPGEKSFITSSHRNGLTKIMARINFSRTRLRSDSWIR
jgi:hypothetical protein